MIKSTNTDIQNITLQAKDRVTRTALKARGELRVGNSWSVFDTCRVDALITV